MSESDTLKALKESLDAFVRDAEEKLLALKQEYDEEIQTILQEINEAKLKEIKNELNP